MLQQRAERDRLNAIQDRVSDDTRDLLIRFGRRKVFSGGGIGGAIGGGSPGSLGILSGTGL